MKNYLLVLQSLLIGLFVVSCEKDALDSADLTPTHTYRLYNPSTDSPLMDGAYEMYVYYDISKLSIYQESEYLNCKIDSICNFVDRTDSEKYDFEFDQIIPLESGRDSLLHYAVLSYRDQSVKVDELGQNYMLESSVSLSDTTGMLIKKYEHIGVMERTRYID